MLDRRMVYTCAYWPDANNLDQAQESKLELVCNKLNPKPGQRILAIGCGWGRFAKYAAETRGVEVVGIAAELGRGLCRGLPVELRLMTSGSFRARKTQLWQILFSKTGLPKDTVRQDIVTNEDLP